MRSFSRSHAGAWERGIMKIRLIRKIKVQTHLVETDRLKFLEPGNETNMQTLAQIQQTLRSHQLEFRHKYGVERLAIFGSYARNEQTENSDIDILVELGQQLLGMRYLELAAELETILQHKVDIVSRRAIKQQYFQAIEQDLIYV